MGGYAVSPKFRVNKELEEGTDLDGGNLALTQVRKGTANQTSDKLQWHQACIAGKMSDEDGGSLGDVQDAFKKATKSCKSENPY